MVKSDTFELKTSTEIFDPRGAISGKYMHFWPSMANIWSFWVIKLPVIAPNFFIGVSEAQLKGKLNGIALRVPTPNVSVVDMCIQVEKKCTAEDINDAFREAAAGPMKGILEYTEDPIVSADIVGNPHSSILDSGMTSAQGNMVKVFGWYDNEMGYSSRVADLVQRIG